MYVSESQIANIMVPSFVANWLGTIPHDQRWGSFSAATDNIMHVAHMKMPSVPYQSDDGL
jgi:hypothetical protein